MVHAWKNFNGTVSFVGRRSRNVFLDRIGRQNDLYTSCSPTNPFSCTSLSLSLFLISRFVSRSTNWDQSIFANSKYGNQMSQFPGIRGKLGLNRRSSNMFLIGFHLDTCHWSGLGYSRKYFISFEVNIYSVNDVMYDNLEKLLLFCLLENISSYAEVYNNCVTLYLIYI